MENRTKPETFSGHGSPALAAIGDDSTKLGKNGSSETSSSSGRQSRLSLDERLFQVSLSFA